MIVELSKFCKSKFIEFNEKEKNTFGAKCYCNICGNLFRKFLSFGVGGRLARCPVCDSLERQRHLYFHLSPLMPLMNNKKVLHFAPEKIIKDLFIKSDASYFDTDIQEGRARYQEDITHISFEDNKFDFIICIHVLEHILDDLMAMRELYRVLNDDGVAFLSVPICVESYENSAIVTRRMRTKHFGQYDHVRKYSLELFLSRLQSVGFDTSVTQPSDFDSKIKSKMSVDMNLGDSIVLARKKTNAKNI